MNFFPTDLFFPIHYIYNDDTYLQQHQCTDDFAANNYLNFLCPSRHIKHYVFHQSLHQLFSNYSAKIIHVCNKNKLTMASVDYSWLIFPNKYLPVFAKEIRFCAWILQKCAGKSFLLTNFQITNFLLLTTVQKYQIHKPASNNNW